MIERFFFLHLQKTGGSSLKMQLRHHFGERAIYPCPDDGELPDAVIRPAHLLERFRLRGDEIRVVAGHFPLATTELLPGDYKTFTLLREPVERTLSFLRHQISRGGQSGADLVELYEDPLRFRTLQNHMTKMLALDAEETLSGGAIIAPAQMDDALLETACERLANLDVVGVQERHDDFVAALEREFGWDLGPKRSDNRTRSESVDPAFRERIAQDNALDMALYQYALRLLENRKGA